MKTLDDYLKDPDLVNEPAEVREVHAIRLKIHDETRNMTPSEHTAYFRRGFTQIPALNNISDRLETSDARK
ncbi:MAG: hypothetical protein LBP68_00970 [Acidobacteriota bacterium]|nr:hypothetical protein [Acidobacteriota bacterium]